MIFVVTLIVEEVVFVFAWRGGQISILPITLTFKTLLLYVIENKLRFLAVASFRLFLSFDTYVSKSSRDPCIDILFLYMSYMQVYVIDVVWSEGTTTTIYRRYSTFFEFQVSD